MAHQIATEPSRFHKKIPLVLALQLDERVLVFKARLLLMPASDTR